MSQDVEPILWAGALVIKDQCVLVLKETDKPFYMLPGGKVETGETDEQAVMREALEEVGVEVTLKGVFTEILEHSKVNNQMVRFKLYGAELAGELDVHNLPGKTEEIIWIDSTFDKGEVGNLLAHVLPLLATKGLIG